MWKVMVLVVVALILWAGPAQGQPPDSLWSRSLGGSTDDGCHSVIQLANGGYALAGTTTSFGDGRTDYWLVILDENGDSLWSRTYGSAGNNDCNTVIQTSDGGFALVGTWGGMGLVKVDSSGQELWRHIYNDGTGYSLLQTHDGGFALAGTGGLDAGANFTIVKTDANGEEQWNHAYGGGNLDECYALVETSDHGFALAGGTKSFSADEDFYLVRIDSTGSLIWQQSYGRAGPDYCFSLVALDDGGFALGGETTKRGSEIDTDFYLIRTDASGQQVWAHNFGGYMKLDGCNSLKVCNDGSFIMGGVTNSSVTRNANMLMMKVSPDGDSLWSKNFGGREVESCLSLIQTADSGYALAGYTYSFGSGAGDFWIVKTTAEPPNGVGELVDVTPIDFSLASPFPNPFNGTVRLNFRTAVAGNYRMELVDQTGRRIATLFEGIAGAGENSVTWNATAVPAGEYYVILDAGGGGRAVRPLALVK